MEEVMEAPTVGIARPESRVDGPGPPTKVRGGSKYENDNGGKNETSHAKIDPLHANTSDLDTMKKPPS